MLPIRGNRKHSTNDDDNRVVPRFSGSKENLWQNVAEGVIESADLTPDFKLDLKAKTPYGRQDAPFAAVRKERRPPLAPLVVRVGDDDVDVTRRTMSIDLAEQEELIATQEAVIAAMSAKLANLNKHVELQGNLIASFCAYFETKNPGEFD